MPMEVIITSAPEREDLFAEIYDGEYLWAFVERQPNGSLSVRIVSPKVEPIWTFDLDSVLDVHQRVKSRLGSAE